MEEVCRRVFFVRNNSLRSLCRSSLSSLRGNVALASTSAPGTGAKPDIEARPYEDIPRAKYFLNINWDMLRNPRDFPGILKKLNDELGKIFKETGIPGLPPMVFIFDPEDTEKVYRAGDKSYPARLTIEEWCKAREELNLPKGLFLEKDEKWLKHRVPISKYIMMPRKMAQYWSPFNDVSLDLVKYVRDHRGPADELSDTLAALTKWSYESISLFVLGKRLGCLDDPMPPDCQEFINHMQGFIDTSNKLLFGIPLHKYMRTKNWKKLVQQTDFTYSYSSNLIKAKIEEIEKNAMEKNEESIGDDFLTHMVCSGKMDIKEIAVNAVDLLAAGVDTTSVTMASCLYELATNPDVQEKLRREVQEVVGNEERVTPEHIQNLHYLRDCVKETQRLYPIAPSNARILSEDIVLSGYKVPAGVVIVMSTVVTGKLKDNFPEPETFKPERWSRDSKNPPNPFSALPFGFGRRMCVGRRVAELEMHIVLAQLMRNFRITFMEDKPIKYITNLFYYPERKINLTFKEL